MTGRLSAIVCSVMLGGPLWAAYSCVADAPPRASLISISAPGPSGDSTVTGAAGAVPGGSVVVLVTLDTGHSAYATAGPDGSFATNLFAPPGVSVLVKAGAASVLSSNSMFMCFPATIIGAGQPPVNSSALAVTGAGITNQNFSLPLWTFQGSIPKLQYSPGDVVHLTGTLSIFSSALPSAGAMSVSANLVLEPLSGPDGTGALGHNTFASMFVTPTGFPIEREPAIDTSQHKQFAIVKSDPTHATASIDLPFTLPANLTAGYFRPFVQFSFTGVPDVAVTPSPYNGQSNGLFSVTNAQRLLGQPEDLLLPVVRVGNPNPPRMFWTLLLDELSGGTRGVQSIEDAGKFGTGSRIVTQSDTFIVPRTDSTGAPIPYRLEPFALSVSVSDAATPMPSIPIIPFRFPSGSLTVTIRKPDGSVTTIGPAPFVQSRSRELAMPAGQTIDPGGGNIQDAYQLSTMDPRFEVPFTEDGLHIITLGGSIDDIYGNTWTGGGTYKVYVARELSLDTAVLPGTPFVAGDVFAPGVAVSPPGAASVQVRVRLLPNSSAGAVEDTTISGRANSFGYFHAPGNGTTMDQPGEYRADVTASFIDKYGNLWMGSRTWGGVVAPKTPAIISHGQRGTDATPYLSSPQWFYRTQTPVSVLPSNDHIRFPFNSGDVVWAQQSDAVTTPLTFQDPTGETLSILQTRPIQGHPELLPLGQASLYLSCPDGQDPSLEPSNIDIWGYGYSAVERPLVRVREEILGGSNTTSPYWRFSSVAYHGQFGANGYGDLPNEFKFQYGGVVLRGSALPQPEYAIYGSLFMLVPDNDPNGGSRVFPPFEGNGGGPSGGPLMTLNGRKIDIFFHPTGVRPGSVLETGDTFAMAGAVGPTLPALVTYTVTTPSGKTASFSGRANQVGYYYHPADDFVVNEAGVYTVALQVTYDGVTSAGQVSQPFPSGDILGTPDGRFYIYVTPKGSAPLATNVPGALLGSYSHNIFPYTITAAAGSGHATAMMPGFVLAQGPVTGSGSTFQFAYDPANLAKQFPINAQQFSNGDMATITLFDPATNLARIVVFNGWELLNMEAPSREHTGGGEFHVPAGR